MRKILGIIAILAMSIGVMSCSSSIDEDLTTVPEMVTISLDCSLGNSTRATTNNLYTQLYNKVVSKELVADTYDLTFTDKNTRETFNLKGEWNSKSMVSIKSGEYKIVGTSTAYGEVLQDKCSIKFDTEAVINRTTTKLTLKAEYDCFLLIFDKNVIDNAYLLYGIDSSALTEKHFFECNNIIYGFSKKLYNEKINISQYLVIDYNDNSNVRLELDRLTPKIGEYYIFNEYTTTNGEVTFNWQSPSFTIEKMTCGKL